MSNGETEEFLPDAVPVSQAPHLLAEMIGTKIGRYKLLQMIGEGGFGIVYMAEQEHPIRRRVALKVIKAGMDTKSVVARFEAERQALAMMDHPNIARVLDGGATEAGRPYFVMELVNGISITQYCDSNRLTPQERLELFVPVCRAVQHAHTKGIIHRDLKPGNVLITLHDGKPVPKVIDFGIAKATHGRLTDHTLFTEFRQMIGTPEYMSPEQAEMSGLDIDTRSDVYSLGVMIYELLTGSTPFDPKELRSKAYVEMQRMIREIEPPRPSTRAVAGQTSQTAEQRCRVEPAKLGRMLATELDWVVMKCLEKDRTRRYDSAGALADEIERYLRDEAVLATPPSKSYRVRRFVRRYKLEVAVAGVVAGALIAGLGMTSYGLIAARQQRDVALRATQAESAQRKLAEEAKQVAETQRLAAARSEAAARDSSARADQAAQRSKAVTQFLTNMVRSAGADRVNNSEMTVRQMAEKAESELASSDFSRDPLQEAELRHAIGECYFNLGLNDAALRVVQVELSQRESALAPDNPALGDTLELIARIYWGNENYATAINAMRRATDIGRRAGIAPDQLASRLQKMQAFLANRSGDPRELRQVEKELSELLERIKVGSEKNETPEYYLASASVADSRGNFERAEQLRAKALSLYGTGESDKMNRGTAMVLIADSQSRQQKWKLACENYAEAIKLIDAARGEGHFVAISAYDSLASAQAINGDSTAAARTRMKRIDVQIAQITRELSVSPGNPDLRAKRVDRYLEAGRFNEALVEILAMNPRPKDSLKEFDRASLAAAARDMVRYRAVCEQLVSEFGVADSSDDIYNMAFSCLVIPEQSPLTPAQVAARMAKTSPDASDPEDVAAWVPLQALVHYRNGQYKEASAFDPTSAQKWGSSSVVTTQLIAAMAKCKIGKEVEGRRDLLLAERVMRRIPIEPGVQPLPTADRFGWMLPIVLQREARQLMPIKPNEVPSTQPGDRVIASTDEDSLRTAMIVGDEVTVTGRVTSVAWSPTGKVMNAELAASPSGYSMLVVVFVGYREEFDRVFGGDVASTWSGKNLRVVGTLVSYGGRDRTRKGTPQMILTQPANASIIPEPTTQATGK